VLAGLRRQWPIAASLGVVLVGLVVVGMGHFRRGTVLMSFGITLALFLRILLSQQDAGMLAVRSKKVDVLVLAVLAVGTSLLSLWVPPPSN
jgi:hypothetical protein